MKDNQPRPNMKNKTFVQWSRAETCRLEDNIVSSEWREKLKRMDRFVPAYDNKPLNMVYLLSGEYGRIWMRERDEWFKASYTPRARAADFEKRKKKIRMEAKAAKKAAEINAKERKQRREIELEAKAKAKAEELERVKERVRKLAAPKLPPNTPKVKKKTHKEQPPPETEEKNDEKVCPKGWKQVELTLQCDCSDKKEDENNKEIKEVKEEQKTPAVDETEESKQNCFMCDGYVEQLKTIHDKNVQEAKEECERSAEPQ